MTDALLTCQYCRQPLGARIFEYRPPPSRPIYTFCNPDCRADFADGYGLTAADWDPEAAP